MRVCSRQLPGDVVSDAHPQKKRDKRDLFVSLSQEEFDALEVPTEDEILDAMERGRRDAAAAGHRGAAQCPRRRLPEDSQ